MDHVRISTIHRFQGGEEPIIIFDSCDGPGTRVAPMLDDTRNDSDARLVLNVAITRARDRLYFVGHTQHLLSGVHSDSALSRIIHHFYEKADVRGSETLVDSYFTTNFEKWAEALLPTAQPPRRPVSGDLYTERDFWAQFFQDLRTIKDRLIILSPFISVNRGGRLIEFFRAIVGRGAEIRIYTKPRNQQAGEMANQADVVIGQLRGIGVKVIERRSMHQKIAIVDDAIAWEGSLNILSHRDTGEQMRRFEGPTAIEEIIRNLELDEDTPVGTQTEEECLRSGCGGFLVVRVQRGSARRFLGCSNYPRCRYTRPIK